MKEFLWLFPIIFIFHDMEEIVGFGLWLRKNKDFLGEKYPAFIKPYKDFSTEGFALAVFEELALCILFSALAYFTDWAMIRYIWLGGFIGCALHFVIHIGQAVVLRQYIPAVITSVMCLPVSIYIIYKCLLTVGDDLLMAVVFMVIGVIVVGVNLKAVQGLIGWFTRKMKLPPVI